MAINVALNTLSTLNNTSILTQSNSNFNAIQTALLNALSLNGQSPNQMQSTLDMNSNQIINLPPPSTSNSPARLADVNNNILNVTVSLVSGLPSPSTVGNRAFVTDATATTFASIVAGGGSNKVPVYSDGSNWRIG